MRFFLYKKLHIFLLFCVKRIFLKILPCLVLIERKNFARILRQFHRLINRRMMVCLYVQDMNFSTNPSESKWRRWNSTPFQSTDAIGEWSTKREFVVERNENSKSPILSWTTSFVAKMRSKRMSFSNKHWSFCVSTYIPTYLLTT